MANLPESADWIDGIYQLETTDPVLGGPDGIDNLQAKQLAARTRWLRALLEELGEEKAPLASPALTGTPTAPTAAAGTNSTQIATTAFVRAAIAALVNSSPAALDTLNELADAVGNDPNFATTMTNALANKVDKVAGKGLSTNDFTAALLTKLNGIAAGATANATDAQLRARGSHTGEQAISTITGLAAALAALAPLASPSLTGTPTAPTAAAGTNTTQIATTAFVRTAVINNNPIGVGQTWQDLSASRVKHTVYTNSTGRTIAFALSTNAGSSAARGQVSPDGVTWIQVFYVTGNTDVAGSGLGIVPPGWRYRVSDGTSTGFSVWSELR